MKPVAGAERVQVWIAEPQEQAANGPTETVEIWGLSSEERLYRTLRAAGVPDGQITTRPPSSAFVSDEMPGPLLIFRQDYVFDERLVHALLEKSVEYQEQQGGDRVIGLVDPEAQSVVVAAISTSAQAAAVCCMVTSREPINHTQQEQFDRYRPADRLRLFLYFA